MLLQVWELVSAIGQTHGVEITDSTKAAFEDIILRKMNHEDVVYKLVFSRFKTALLGALSGFASGAALKVAFENMQSQVRVCGDK